MKLFKEMYADQPGVFEAKQFRLNMLAGFLGGAIGSGLTNAFDVLTINK
jgi:hypothetical protein